MLFDGPFRSLFFVSPLFAERAIPAAFCCAFDFAGMIASTGIAVHAPASHKNAACAPEFPQAGAVCSSS